MFNREQRTGIREQNIELAGQNISLEHQDFLRKVKLRKISIISTQLFMLISFFVIWELAARYGIIDSFITSQPTKIVKTIANLYSEGELFKHIGITCLETVVGFLLGTVIGTVIAVILWWSKFICDVFEPYLVVLNSLPKIALGPIIIIWMGAGTGAIITMTLAISLIVTILEVLNGFLGVDPEKIKLLDTFGATKIQKLMKVILPASFPTIINALKINVGLSWVGVIMGEFLVSKAGLGYLIIYGGQVFQLDLVMTSIIILAIAAALMYQGIVYLEKLLVKNSSDEHN